MNDLQRKQNWNLYLGVHFCVMFTPSFVLICLHGLCFTCIVVHMVVCVHGYVRCYTNTWREGREKTDEKKITVTRVVTISLLFGVLGVVCVGYDGCAHTERKMRLKKGTLNMHSILRVTKGRFSALVCMHILVD